MTNKNLPLSNYRIVDFGWVWAGTLLGSILGSYGAEVIKVESKRRIDGMRFGKIFELGEELEKNSFFQNLNRNKFSVTIDISKAEGQRLIKELVKKSDIVIENFAPGALDRRGLNYDELRKEKPDIIMISLSPMGQLGPLSQIVTYAPIISALSGIDSLIGYPGDSPIGFKHAYADVTASMCGLFALLSALWLHARTGEGQYIDLSQCESVMPAMGIAFMEYAMNNRVMGVRGNSSTRYAPHGIYPCAGDDKWISIAVKTDEEWHNFYHVLGSPAWATEDKYCDHERRVVYAVELDQHISAWTSQRRNIEVAETLQRAGVAATPVLTTEDIFLNPHFIEREAYVEVEHPINGNTFLYNWPWKIHGLDSNKRMRYAPLLGEHNDYVLGDLLRLSKEERTRLEIEEVIY